MSAEEHIDMGKPGAAATGHRRSAIASLLVPRLQSAGLPIALVVLVFFFSIKSDLFLTAQNFRNIGLQAAALAAVLLFARPRKV